MSTLELFVLSVALGTDLFSVAIPIGMTTMRIRVLLRAAVVFALFHIVLILSGCYIGHFLGAVVEHAGTVSMAYPILAMENWASILGALVLTVLGIYMIKENLVCDVPDQHKTNPLKGGALLLLATSVSIDALAAGFSLGMMDVDLVKLSLLLGIVIFLIALLGLSLGRRAGHCLGKRAELMGGIVLISLGIHVIYSMLSL